jgi:hypothetical protein
MSTSISHPLDGGRDTSCTVPGRARGLLRPPLSSHRGKVLFNGGKEFLSRRDDVAGSEQPDLGQRLRQGGPRTVQPRDMPSEPHPNEGFPGSEARAAYQQARVVANQRGELRCRCLEFDVRREPTIGMPLRLSSALLTTM